VSVEEGTATVRCPRCERDIRVGRSETGEVEIHFLPANRGGGLSLDTEAPPPASGTAPTQPAEEEETADDVLPAGARAAVSEGLEDEAGWWDYLSEAWAYPFRGGTWWAFLLWAAGCSLVPRVVARPSPSRWRLPAR
jgi:hypothetical protein